MRNMGLTIDLGREKREPLFSSSTPIKEAVLYGGLPFCQPATHSRLTEGALASRTILGSLLSNETWNTRLLKRLKLVGKASLVMTEW